MTIAISAISGKKAFFSFQQTRSILTQFTQEALVQILSLPKATCSFDQQNGLKHLFLNLNLERAIAPIQHKIRYWWELHSDISSPFQRPLVEDWGRVKWILARKYHRNSHWIEQFSQSLKKLSCLYEIAGHTQTSTLELALMLRPQIKGGVIKMLSYQDIQEDHRPVVICVNNRQSLQRIVQFTLETHGFKVTCIQDPFKALAVIMSQLPSVILIDPDLPNMNGYELCRLLRNSSAIQHVPIVLLTEKQGIIERIQSKLAKASTCLSKPFLPQELLQVVDNYARA